MEETRRLGEPAAPPNLADELVRIDKEKARLRRLADQLGLLEPQAREALPEPEPSGPASAAGAASGARRSLPLDAPPIERPARRRPSLPAYTPEAPAADLPRPHMGEDGSPPPSAGLLEALAGFVPSALYDEVRRERDELFFRVTRLEVERSQVESVRRSLDAMEAEVRRLEGELRRRRAAEAAVSDEPLRLSYRRWLDLRRRRAVHFSDYLACRRQVRE